MAWAMVTHGQAIAAAEAYQASLEYWAWWFSFFDNRGIEWIKWEH